MGALGRRLQPRSWASCLSKGRGEEGVSGGREPTELQPVRPQHKLPGPLGSRGGDSSRTASSGSFSDGLVPAVQGS